jgi:hypothetical protein
LRHILNILLLTFLVFSCNTTEINQEEKLLNDVLFSIIADNSAIFSSDCRLLDKLSNKLMPPSINYDIDSTFLESIKDFFDEREFDNLLSQKRNIEKFSVLSTKFGSKYQLIRVAEIDSLISRVETDKHLVYWTELENEVGCLQVFSRPIISADKKTVIVRHMELIGPHTAGGFIIVFQLRNDKWIVAREIETWIS